MTTAGQQCEVKNYNTIQCQHRLVIAAAPSHLPRTEIWLLLVPTPSTTLTIPRTTTTHHTQHWQHHHTV